MTTEEEIKVPKDWAPIFIWNDYLYKQQKQFTLSKAWANWFVSGNGTGKTLVFYFNIVLYLLGIHPNQLGAKKDEKTGKVTAPPLKIRVLVPSFDHVRDVALEKLTQRQRITQANLDVGPLLPKSMVKQGYSKEHKGIELKNGAALWWVTSEQGWEVMRGGEQDILGMDEEGDENVFNQLKRGLRNAMAGGKILGVLTPPYLEGQGPTWTKEAVVDAALDDPDVYVVNSCMKDNPAITKDFIRRWTKGKSKEQVDVEVYGKYPSWGKMLFYAWQDREWNEKTVDGHILPMDMEIPKNHEVDWVMAFDWHQSKACAAVWGYVDRDGNVVILDELDKEMAENKDISELVEIFKQIEGQPFSKRKWRRWQDPSAKHKYNALRKDFNAWDEFKRHGVLTTEGRNRDPEVGISIVNDYLKGNMKDHPRLFVRENCKYVRRYMNNHYWKKGKGDGKPTPDAKWSDYPICVRYILQELGYKDKKKDRKPYPYYSFQTEDDNKKVVNLERFIG